MHNAKQIKWISMRLPAETKRRIDLESVLRGVTITEVMVAAIDALPKARIVVDETPSTRRKAAAE